MAADGEREREPLAKAELSLKFPTASTGGVFNMGEPDSKRKDFITSFTSSGAPPVIPEAMAGSDWKSVLIAREPAPGILKVLTLNCCFQNDFTLTRAQWLWMANLLFFAAHLTLGILVVESAGRNPDSTLVDVWRTARNFSSSAQLGYTVHLEKNGWPVRLDWIIGSIFFISALSHLFIVAAGPFDSFVRVLWRQLDLGFSYWRWLELSITGPLMLLTIALITGLQEQVLLAAVFMLSWGAFICILMTEAMSRPVAVESGKFDMSRYIGDREMFDGDDVGQKMMVEQQRRSNFRFRTFPTQIAVFLGVAAWWIVLQSWFVQLDDLKRSGVADAYDRVHRWIMWSVFTTLVFGLLGLLVTVRYQMLPPARRWEAELYSYVLAAVPKIVLGLLVWQHALQPDMTVAEALTLMNTTAVNVSALGPTV